MPSGLETHWDPDQGSDIWITLFRLLPLNLILDNDTRDRIKLANRSGLLKLCLCCDVSRHFFFSFDFICFICPSIHPSVHASILLRVAGHLESISAVIGWKLRHPGKVTSLSQLIQNMQRIKWKIKIYVTVCRSRTMLYSTKRWCL